MPDPKTADALQEELNEVTRTIAQRRQEVGKRSADVDRFKDQIRTLKASLKDEFDVDDLAGAKALLTDLESSAVASLAKVGEALS